MNKIRTTEANTQLANFDFGTALVVIDGNFKTGPDTQAEPEEWRFEAGSDAMSRRIHLARPWRNDDEYPVAHTFTVQFAKGSSLITSACATDSEGAIVGKTYNASAAATEAMNEAIAALQLASTDGHENDRPYFTRTHQALVELRRRVIAHDLSISRREVSPTGSDYNSLLCMMGLYDVIARPRGWFCNLPTPAVTDGRGA